jgi:hypothetical protein
MQVSAPPTASWSAVGNEGGRAMGTGTIDTGLEFDVWLQAGSGLGEALDAAGFDSCTPRHDEADAGASAE